MTVDRSHLNALEMRLHNETMRLKAAKTPQEAELRAVWVAGIEREISAEYAFLGLKQPELEPEMTMDEIMNELGL